MTYEGPSMAYDPNTRPGCIGTFVRNVGIPLAAVITGGGLYHLMAENASEFTQVMESTGTKDLSGLLGVVLAAIVAGSVTYLALNGGLGKLFPGEPE